MMEKYEMIRIQDHKELITQAAGWFHQKWGIPKEAYLNSMEECVRNQDNGDRYTLSCNRP